MQRPPQVIVPINLMLAVSRFTPSRMACAWIISTGLSIVGASGALGQEYPNKPLRIVTSDPGGANDFTARLIAPGLSKSLGQPVIIENRPTIISIETAARAPADGYTVLLQGPITWLAPFLRENNSWDPVRDFSPVTLVSVSPNILVVHPSLPVKSVKDLIALAKARPGVLNYAAAAAGTPQHLSGELFNAMAGVKIVAVPFRSSGLSVTALVGGQVDLMYPSAGAAAPQIKAGRLRALAVTGAQPSAVFPDLPTVAATVPGYEANTIIGMFAPAKTPDAIIRRLNQEMARGIVAPDVKEKLFNSGAEAMTSSPEQLAAAVKADMARMGKVIKDVGIRAD